MAKNRLDVNASKTTHSDDTQAAGTTKIFIALGTSVSSKNQ